MGVREVFQEKKITHKLEKTLDKGKHFIPSSRVTTRKGLLEETLLKISSSPKRSSKRGFILINQETSGNSPSCHFLNLSGIITHLWGESPSEAQEIALNQILWYF